MLLSVFPALLSLVAGGQASQQPLSQDTATPILTPRLDAAIWDILHEFKTPGGVGVAVVHKTAEGIWHLESRGYGNATVGGELVTAGTLFAIGSNSKLFDIFATGLLISNETLTPRISWTSKIASIIPEWKLMDPVASCESSIVDLMSHRTGVASHDFMAVIDTAPQDVISRLQYNRPSAGFREQFQYNNHMYTVLSHLPHAILNVSYEKYVQDNILGPLGMATSTFFFYADAVKTGRLADGFLRQDIDPSGDPFARGTVRTLPYFDRSTKGHAVSGPGGVISSAYGMATWLKMLLQEGKNQFGETVIPPEVVRKAATGVTVNTPIAPYPELSPVVYGGGQRRGTYRGFEKIEHGGSVPAFRSQVTRFPSQNLGVAVLSNEEEIGAAIVESVKYRIIDEVFQLEPIDWPARYRAQAKKDAPHPSIPRPDTAKPPSVAYSALAGAYENAAYAKLDFCLFWENKTTGSVCPTLNLSELPGVIDPAVPTLIARWDAPLANYMRLAHYSGNTFNLTALFSYPSGSGISEHAWVWEVLESRAEFEVKGKDIGFSPIGIAGVDGEMVVLPGATVQERAEVWFTKDV
ncbi:beta-lactamase/transpeptidase-like protein [Mycena metata]|uniref:Beta-lactamase/transpeptidase-like protein n=1 Tax=Mycena metata TaxID=1033252 RepID=A0AAD7JZQ9_9AGAR|nr:beta-lactamase/transpeptidase-like protein [Mycena metata]